MKSPHDYEPFLGNYFHNDFVSKGILNRESGDSQSCDSNCVILSSRLNIDRLRFGFPKGPNLEKSQSCLKYSISLEIFNLA